MPQVDLKAQTPLLKHEAFPTCMTMMFVPTHSFALTSLYLPLRRTERARSLTMMPSFGRPRTGALVTGSRDSSIRIWKAVPTKKKSLKWMDPKLLTGHIDAITCLCMLPDNGLVSGSRDGSLRFWREVGGEWKEWKNKATVSGCSCRHFCVSSDDECVLFTLLHCRVVQSCYQPPFGC